MKTHISLSSLHSFFNKTGISILLLLAACDLPMVSTDPIKKSSTLASQQNTVSKNVAPLIDIDQWLTDHPVISSRIIWGNTGQFGPIYTPWSQWNAQQQADLKMSFSKAYDWYFISAQKGADDIATIPTNVYPFIQDDNGVYTLVSGTYAWQLYNRWIAHTLLLEAYHLVPWSITAYDDESLHILLDASRIMTPAGVDFQLNSAYHNWDPFRKTLSGLTTLSTPIYTYKFLTSNAIFNTTLSSRKTIENLLQWCNRSSMSHMNGGVSFGNMFSYWQYDGGAPFPRMAEGTNASNMNPAFSHWTSGCHGTSGFLKFALRAVNIPVELSQVCGHSLPVFRTEHLFLSHGDDPYTGIGLDNSSSASLPAAGQLVPDVYYQEWFGVSMYADRNVANQGTQPWPYEMCALIGVQPRRLTGTVVASNGSPIANAAVTLVNDITHVATPLHSDGNGNFSVVTMPGNYTVTVVTNCCDSGTTKPILFGNYPMTFKFAGNLTDCVVPCNDQI